MANLPLRVAIVTPPHFGGADRPPAIISGARRSWLRSKRSEPFAACVSVQGAPGYADELLIELEAEFRRGPRLSIMTGLGRAIRAAHTQLVDENRLSLPEQRRSASAILAAARSNGVYVARTGPTIVGSVRARGTWARSGDASATAGEREPPGIGRTVTPHITTEFCPLDAGDVLLLLPGIAVTDLSDSMLSGALHDPLDLDRVAELLAGARQESCGLVVWCPPPDAEAPATGRWVDWVRAASTSERTQPRPIRPVERPTPTAVAASAELPATRAPAAFPRGQARAAAVPLPQITPEAQTEPAEPALPRVQRRTAPAPGTRSRVAPTANQARELLSSIKLPENVKLPPVLQQALRGWATPPRIAIAALALIAVFLLFRGLVASADHSVDDARHIIQEARANPDPTVAAGLLSDAIAIVEPRAPNDENARAVLQEATDARDKLENVVRVSRVRNYRFDAGAEFRPAGLWNTESGTYILDLGAQLLYRFDPTEAKLSVALRPNDNLDGQPVGKFETAAWSPARGVDTQGQLVLIDTSRTIISLDANGSTAKRWWPPDNALWEGVGASAATFEDFFFLDPRRAEIWRYPARLPGAAGSIVATTEQDPELASAVDIATDGNLYILHSDGGVTKLAPGAGPLPFDGTVPDQPLSSPVAIFAHADLDRVWVLEPSAARVVEFTTDGQYVRQYVFPSDMVRNAIALNVDAQTRELRILTPLQMVLVQLT